jgi:hypothetical protein
LFIVGLFVTTSQKATYSVLLFSASGQVKALRSADENYVDRIVNALNEAIIQHG